MAAAPTTYPRPNTYWNFLFETLATVLNRNDAVDLVARLKQEIQKGSLQEQLLFFHNEPLNVALTVTGTAEDPTILSDYLALVKKLNWGP